MRIFKVYSLCWELDYKESWAPKNWCFWTMVLEKTFESPLDYKEIQQVHPKGDHSWVFIGRTDWNSNTSAIWCEELTHLKRPWCWERLRAGGEGDDKGWDGWMASPTQWTWVWVDSGSWWWTGRPGVLRFMRLQRVGHDWGTELKEGSRQWSRTWVWGTSHCFIGYTSVVFDVFTNLGSQYHYLIPEHFITPQNKHCIN